MRHGINKCMDSLALGLGLTLHALGETASWCPLGWGGAMRTETPARSCCASPSGPASRTCSDLPTYPLPQQSAELDIEG